MWISLHYIYSEDGIPTKFDLCHHFIYKLYYIIKYVGDLYIKR